VSGSNVTLGYVAPSALGFPTINATDGVLPYRSSSSAFSDSPLIRLSSTFVNLAGQIGPVTQDSTAPQYTTNTSHNSGLGVGSAGGGSADQLIWIAGTRHYRLATDFLSVRSDMGVGWWSGTTYGVAVDTTLARLAAGIVRVGNGSTGAGKLAVGSSTASSANQFLVDSQGTTVIAGFFSMPGSSTVPTIKAETSSIQSFAFNPSGKLIGGCNIPTTNQQFSAIGNAKSDVSSIGNIGTGVDNLLSFTIQANVLNNTGDYAEFDAFGEFENNANNKKIAVKLGATTIFTTGALPFGVAALANWRINAKIIRTAASGQKCLVTFWSNDGTTKFLQTYTTSGESLTSNLTVQFTGEATATDDITQEHLESKLCVALTS
jgi:hypothetical protein